MNNSAVHFSTSEGRASAAGHPRGRGFRALHPRRLHASILALCRDCVQADFARARRAAIETLEARQAEKRT